MSKKEIINVKAESILAQYFQTLLTSGITIGITEKMYNDFVNELVNKVNTDTSEYAREIRVEPDSFENIVQRMNKIHSERVVGVRLKSIIVDDGNKMFVALPTYELKEWRYDEFKTGLYGRQDKIFKEILQAKIASQILPESKVISKKDDIAKKVASFFVNDLIARYVKSRISKGYWPSQCRDIDKYIFDRDIGKSIDENGTADTFKKAYLHAVDEVCLLLADEEAETIEISNNPYHMLAHANFLKFIMPEELSFLKQYVHHKYEERDAAITVTISQNEVTFRSSACVFSDSYGEWSDDYKHEKGTIETKSVEIMEKRIGIIS